VIPELSARETLQHRPAGTILFAEGDQPRGIYLIHSGTIELLMRARNGEWKRIRTAPAGEILRARIGRLPPRARRYGTRGHSLQPRLHRTRVVPARPR
jgi:CRP-like cAMP-binding protein